MPRHVLARSLHDVGLAAWFGGSLMGAVGLNAAAASLKDPAERSAAATVGWSRWAPVSAVGIGAHLIGATQLLRTELPRVRRQHGVARSSAIKAALTVAAVGTTAYSGILNRQMAAAGHVPVQGATEPAFGTPPDVASTQKQLKAVQWLIPALTGSLLTVTAWQSEQMRPRQVLLGVLQAGLPAGAGRAARLSAAGVAAVLLSRQLRRRLAGRLAASTASHDADVTSLAADSRMPAPAPTPVVTHPAGLEQQAPPTVTPPTAVPGSTL